MADTQLNIANRALDRIGINEPIDDLNTSTRTEALAILRVWDAVWDAVLEERWWPIAKGQHVLVASAFTRHGWQYVCTLPSNFISARFLIVGGARYAQLQPGNRSPFEVQQNNSGTGSVLCLDADPTTVDCLEYTKRIQVEDGVPALFQTAVAWALAGELALSLKKDRVLAGQMLDAYGVWASKAMAAQLNGRQEETEPTDSTPSIAARD